MAMVLKQILLHLTLLLRSFPPISYPSLIPSIATSNHSLPLLTIESIAWPNTSTFSNHSLPPPPNSSHIAWLNTSTFSNGSLPQALNDTAPLDDALVIESPDISLAPPQYSEGDESSDEEAPIEDSSIVESSASFGESSDEVPVSCSKSAEVNAVMEYGNGVPGQDGEWAGIQDDKLRQRDVLDSDWIQLDSFNEQDRMGGPGMQQQDAGEYHWLAIELYGSDDRMEDDKDAIGSIDDRIEGDESKGGMDQNLAAEGEEREMGNARKFLQTVSYQLQPLTAGLSS